LSQFRKRSGSPDVAKKTRRRFLERVKHLNYRPNLAARSLVTGRSSLVGLVVPDLIHPFFSEIAKALAAALRKRTIFCWFPLQRAIQRWSRTRLSTCSPTAGLLRRCLVPEERRQLA